MAVFRWSIPERLNIGVIMASHNPSDARLFSADVAVLEDGLICERGTLEQLTRAPSSRTMKAWRESVAGLLPEPRHAAGTSVDPKYSSELKHEL